MSPGRVRLPCLCLAVLLLAGCVRPLADTRSQGRRETDVAQRMLNHDAGHGRYALDPSQAFVMPVLEASPPPRFPPGYAVASLSPTTLCSSLVVEADGSVRAAGLLQAPGCVDPAQAPPELAEAVRQALEQWRFSPARLCTYADAASRARQWRGGGCDGEPVGARAIPVTPAWAFTFQVRNGRHEVVQRRAGAR